MLLLLIYPRKALLSVTTTVLKASTIPHPSSTYSLVDQDGDKDIGESGGGWAGSGPACLQHQAIFKEATGFPILVVLCRLPFPQIGFRVHSLCKNYVPKMTVYLHL